MGRPSPLGIVTLLFKIFMAVFTLFLLAITLQDLGMYVCWAPWGILIIIYLGLRPTKKKRLEVV